MFEPNEPGIPSVSPGNGESYVLLHLNASLLAGPDAAAAAKVKTLGLMLFHSDASAGLGHYDAEAQVTYLCCTQKLLTANKCGSDSARPFTPIVNESFISTLGPDMFRYDLLEFNSSSETASHTRRWNVTTSGIYYLFMVNCNIRSERQVSITGTVTWMNPYGYLPGEQYPFLPFYGVLSLAYLVLGIWWFTVSACHWRRLLQLQYAIAGVIFLGMTESATWYFDNLDYDVTGQNSMGAIVFGILASTVKRTVSRVLVLVVSLGFGVVKPTLGAKRYQVAVLGTLYLVFSLCLSIVENWNHAEQVPWTTVVFLVVPVALLDTVFYWWIFVSILTTITQLRVRKQTMKISMYRWLFNVLVGSVAVSAVAIVYQMFVVAFSSIDDRWRTWWMWNAFWQLLYFGLLLVIAWLWRPVTNNTRYSYGDPDSKPLVDVEESAAANSASDMAASNSLAESLGDAKLN
jgi:hypothetical protein